MVEIIEFPKSIPPGKVDQWDDNIRIIKNELVAKIS